MGIELEIDVEIDGIKEEILDEIEDKFVKHVEKEVRDGGFECENCEARSFDVETWQNSSGDYEIGAVCRECNEAANIDIDTSELDDLK